MSEKLKNSIIVGFIVIILGATAFLGGMLWEQQSNKKHFDIRFGETRIEGWYQEDNQP